MNVDWTELGAILVATGFGITILTLLYQAISPMDHPHLVKVFIACALLAIAGCVCGLAGSPWLQ